MRTLKPIVLLATLAFALLAAGASGAGGADAVAAKGARLQAFGSCGELLGYVKRHTTPLVGPYGLGGGLVKAMPVGAPTAARDAGGATTDDFSTTNVQEAGVDEPDIVKSNGFHLFTVRGDRLFVVDVRASRPRLVDSLRLEQGLSHELLLYGRQLLVISRGGMGDRAAAGRAPDDRSDRPSRTLLTEVDVGNPAALRVVRTFSVEADYVSARLVGGTVRIVTSSRIPRQLEFAEPAGDGSAGGRRGDGAQPGRRARRPASRAGCRPTSSRTARTGATHTRSLVQCRAVQRSADVLGTRSCDRAHDRPRQGPRPRRLRQRPVGRPDRLRLARAASTSRPSAGPTGRCRRSPTSSRKASGRRSTRSTSRARRRTMYRASGEVPGFLLNQWSLSEFRGVLRVASTESPPWFDPVARAESESFVTTLDERDGKLVVARARRWARARRAHLRGSVRGRHRLRRHVQAGRSALHARSRQPGSPGRARRAEGRGLLRLPPPDRRRPPRSASARTRAAKAGCRALSSRSSTSRTCGARAASTAGRSGRARPRPSTTTTPSSTGRARGSSSCRSSPRRPTPRSRARSRSASAGAGSPRSDGSRTPTRPAARIPIRRSLVVGDRLFTVSDAGVKASSLATLADAGWVGFGSP